MPKKILLLMASFLLLVQCDIPEPADIAPPFVNVVYPIQGSVISANTTVVIGAVDDDAVSKVWYYVDGVKMGESGKAPYEFLLDISSLEKRVDHVLQAGAVDNSDNTGYSEQVIFTVAETPDITPPTVQILNPQPGQTVKGTISIVAHATDDRSVKKVAFFVDDDSLGVVQAYPYKFEWNTTTVTDSVQHNIYAKAFDSGNNSAVSSVVTVFVDQSSK